ncbi:MAG: universal stress protein, partial [Acidobacteriota bacterium]|nr:universal stress protein [Acidobacteriota bacterium]
EEILAHAREMEADLIVMGTHGHRGPARFVLGSVAEKVIRGADCPVLTLRQRKRGPELEAIERILVPIDFSDSSAEGLRTARELGGVLGASLQLLHVIDVQAVPSFYGPAAVVELGDHLRKRALEHMAELYEEAGGPEVPFESFVVSGTPASRIAGIAGEQGSGLIVIPSHGLGGIERWMLGSTAERVGRLAACPVLTLKAGGRSLLAPTVAAEIGDDAAE